MKRMMVLSVLCGLTLAGLGGCPRQEQVEPDRTVDFAAFVSEALANTSDSTDPIEINDLEFALPSEDAPMFDSEISDAVGEEANSARTIQFGDLVQEALANADDSADPIELNGLVIQMTE